MIHHTCSALGSGCRSSAIVGNRPLGSHAFLYGACKILFQICRLLKVAIRAFGTGGASAGGASTSSASGGVLFLHVLFALVFLLGDTLLALILLLGNVLLAFIRNVGTALWLLLGRLCWFGLSSTPISRNVVFLVQTDALSWYLICYRRRYTRRSYGFNFIRTSWRIVFLGFIFAVPFGSCLNS